MQPGSCSSCGAEVRDLGRFCWSCGVELSVAPPSVNHLISINRIVVMSILTQGLYLFYWYYLTWRQYRDHTGEQVYPIWHALTQFVPIYNLFRTHAHFRTYMELMYRNNVASTLIPGYAVVAVLVYNVLGNVSFRLSFGDMTEGTALTVLVLSIIGIAITVALLAHAQRNLNSYWNNVSGGRSLSERRGVGEIIIAVIGVLAWIDTILNLTSESYRMAFQ